MNKYSCGTTFDTEYYRTLLSSREKVGKVTISSKLATISIIEGDFEDIKYKLTSGISGKHGKGGQSQQRFLRCRQEQIKHFSRRVKSYMDKNDIMGNVERPGLGGHHVPGSTIRD